MGAFVWLIRLMMGTVTESTDISVSLLYCVLHACVSPGSGHVAVMKWDAECISRVDDTFVACRATLALASDGRAQHDSFQRTLSPPQWRAVGPPPLHARAAERFEAARW